MQVLPLDHPHQLKVPLSLYNELCGLHTQRMTTVNKLRLGDLSHDIIFVDGLLALDELVDDKLCALKLAYTAPRKS